MMELQFQANLAQVLAHTIWFEHKQGEVCSAFCIYGTGLFVDAPKVPEFRPVKADKEQAKAVAANMANFGDISKLAGDTNAFNQAQLDAMLKAGIPGYEAMAAGIGKNINSFIAGELPSDVAEQIKRNSAGSAISGGFGGSGMARNLVARDLGLTSLDLISKGMDAGNRWIATARESAVAPQFNVASMFLSPEQQIQTKMFNTAGRFQRDWMKNQIDQQYSTASKIDADVSASMSATNEMMSTL